MKILTLYPDTFLWVKGTRGLLYNSLNFNSLEFNVNPSIASFCSHLLNVDNLYCFPYSKDTSQPEIQSLIKAIEEKKLGYLQNIKKYNISFPPILSLQQEKSHRRNGTIQDDLLSNFTSLTIYAGGKGWNRNHHIQTDYPSSFDDFLSIHLIKNFIKNTIYSGLNNLKIIFSNISMYPNLQSLVSFLEEQKLHIEFAFRANELTNFHFFNELQNKELFHINIFHDFSMEKEEKTIANFKSKNVRHTFFVYSESDYKRVKQTQYSQQNIEVIPLFNNKNISFFKKNVFIHKDEILQSHLSRKIIFAHQVLNTHYFGKLIILPNEYIYSNLSTPPLGHITTPISQIVAREFEKNYAWRTIRDTAKCKECIYQYMCPSPSFYEAVIGIDCIIN